MRHTISLVICMIIAATAYQSSQSLGKIASITVCDSVYVATDHSQQVLVSSEDSHQVASELVALGIKYAQFESDANEHFVSDLVRALDAAGIETTLLI